MREVVPDGTLKTAVQRGSLAFSKLQSVEPITQPSIIHISRYQAIIYVLLTLYITLMNMDAFNMNY